MSDLRKRVIGDKEILFDEEGFFVIPEDWTEAIAEIMATEMGMSELSARQWETIRFLRAYYVANGRAPLNREFRKQTGLSLLEVEGLFQGGIRGGARRLAGLPNPKNC